MSLGWSAAGWVLAALLLFWAVGAYNRLMRLRNAIGQAYGLLDQQLQQRAELGARLQALARPVLVNEQASFDALEQAQTEAQTAAQAARARPYKGDPVASLAVAAALHGAALTRLASLTEHHGELGHQAEVRSLLEELRLCERQRGFARQGFNQAVAAYNEALQQFPTRILAGLFAFGEARSM